MSDGRVTQQKTIMDVDVLQEDFKKLLKVNANICIGFAGAKEQCEEVLKCLNNYTLNNLNLDNVIEIINNEAKSVYSKYMILGIQIKILMAIGGIQDGVIKFKTFSSVNGFKIEKYIPKGDEISYAMLSPDGVDIKNLVNQIYANAPCTSDSLKKAMGGCIDNVSQFNNTVNNVKFTEILRR